MIARKQLDAGWNDLAYAAAACLGIVPARAATQPILTRRPDAIVCLSVRSGFDLLLSELAWPPGSEVLVGAITIPDIPRIIEAHGLVPVPVDVDPETLAIDEEMLARVHTPRARALLVTHLFGSRIDVTAAVAWAHDHGLALWEDCAQAFTGDAFTGEPASDVRMFSFGPIKTATALGGGVLLVRDASLLERLRQRHATWPVQSTRSYARRVLRMAFFKPLLTPRAYGMLIAGLRAFGRNHDETITRLGRSFASGDFFARLRQRPCVPLIRLLERRLSTYDRTRVLRRAAAGERLRASLRTYRPIAASAAMRTHWLFPVRVPGPETLKYELWSAGFDATCGSSSLYALPAARGQRPAAKATAAMNEVLYVPVEPGMSAKTVARLAACLNRATPTLRLNAPVVGTRAAIFRHR